MIAYVPTFSPLVLPSAPERVSPSTSEPDVMVYARVGSASPYVFDTAVAVTEIARSITVIVFATDDAAL